MPGRVLFDQSPDPAILPSVTSPLMPDLIMRAPPNWTAVGFFAALGMLHLSIWAIALSHRHMEGYLSLGFGVAFLFVALACYLSTFEIAVLCSENKLRLRTGYRRFRYERFIPFKQVRGVRLTLTPDPDYRGGRIELLCPDEDIECPATPVARQEALCLAMTMGVRLIKVSDRDDFGPPRAT
jgi:hypothetical protein